MRSAGRLGLGGVQFGQRYGINNPGGQVPAEEVLKILKRVQECGVDLIDTASAYGNSEEIIGEFFRTTSGSFKIVSKFSVDGWQKGDLKRALESSLATLKVASLYGYLSHRVSDVAKYPGLWEELTDLKRQRLVKKIGVSIYSPGDLDELNRRGIGFDMVQCPYSIFDRRFEGPLQAFKQQGIEVHVRSVFLQGLAFMQPETLPAYFQDAKAPLTRLRRLASGQGMTMESLCLNFALLNPSIDRVIIGVDGLEQFERNLQSLKDFEKIKVMAQELKSLKIDNEEILLPYKWPKSEPIVKI